MIKKKDDISFFIDELINKYFILDVFRNISLKIESYIYNFNKRNDLNGTKNIDINIENIVISEILNINLSIKIVSEESGELIIGKNPRYIVFLDPLDGTDNFLQNIPIYSISIAIALIENFTLLIGYVKNLVLGEEFFAIYNQGAFFNNKRIVNRN